ncbi:MAG: hypothetical protein K5897_11355 [Eubacterium sp.]|nr:hypothetical protein [Eubacterium sp.]
MSRRNNRDIVMRRLIILFSVITLAAIGFLIFFLSHTISNKESCRDAGIEEFQSGNYERAISSFQRSLAEEQWFSTAMDLDTRMYLAKSFLRLEKYRDAVDCYKKLQQDNDGSLNNDLILSMQEMAEAQAAIKEGGSGVPSDETIRRLQQLAPDQPYLYLQLASAYNRKGDLSSAKQALISYLDSRPLNTYVAYELSTAYLKEGNLTEAKNLIDKGLACKDETYTDLLEYNDAVLLEMNGDLEGAFQKLEELHSLYKDNETITKEYDFLYTRVHPHTEPVNPHNDALEDNSGE